jgi:hypothetical protein
MGVFTWRQRGIVYLTNFGVIGLGAAIGALVDIFYLKNGHYWAAAASAILSFPIVLWLTIVLLRGSIKPKFKA